MNIYQMKNANYVNMVILKPKMKNAFIAEVIYLEVLAVMNVDMNLMKVEMKQIIFFVKIVFLLVIIFRIIIFIIIKIIIIFLILY